MKAPEKFEELYGRLNAHQKEAVDSIEGPVMVIAGPGTGKTQILTLRIANIITKTDTAPENILALTFTEAGVHAMRTRLVDMIGAPGYKVRINTFHGFANDVITRFPEEFPVIIGAQHVTEVEQVRQIEEIITSLPLKEIKPFGDPAYYVRDILSAVSKLKREAVTPDDFTKIIKRELEEFEKIPDLYHEKGAWKGKMKGEYRDLLKRLEKNKELAIVYAAYEDALRTTRHYDYNDMIVQVVGALRTNEDLLRTLQEEHQYILVDEHQDTNNAQNAILELMSNFHPSPNLFIVGDEKQAIYRFQGASLENFLYFKNLYPDAKLIVLENNYRSTQSILDSAHGVLAGEKKLKANAPHEALPIRLFAFSRPEIEQYFLAKDIKEKIAAGTPPSDIAILYRDNKDAFGIAEMLEKFGVPFGIESDQDIMTDRDIRKLIAILYMVDDIGNDQKLVPVLHIDFLGCDPLNVYTIMQYASKERMPLLRVMRSAELLDALKIHDKDILMRRAAQITAWGKGAKNEDLLPFVERVIRESDFLTHILRSPDALEKIDKLTALFNEMQRLVADHKSYELHDFLEYLVTLASHNLLIKKAGAAPSGGSSASGGRVHLMTAHRSKGQEFSYVYMVQAFDGHWGNRRRRDKITIPAVVFSKTGDTIPEDADNQDETRLFYVALTRAKKEVTITYARQNASGDEQLPSEFIQNIHEDLIKKGSSDIYEEEYASAHELRVAPRVSMAPSIKEKAFIAGVLEERGLSVTGLNHFLECPWKYFYSDVLHIPRAKSRPELYGIAVHAALKDFFDAIRTGDTPDKKFLLDRFALYMNRAPLGEEEFQASIEKGNHALTGYYDTYHESWRMNTLTEFNVTGVTLGGEGREKNLKLIGKIDKIEFLEADGAVNVVDYKTGKPKTRGQMEGKTKDATGNEKRQLVFYDILLRGHDGGKMHMMSGDIDFLEPDDKGRYHKENFVVSEEDRTEVRRLIEETAGKIRELSFWNEACDEKDCEFCGLRKMM
jgi:DNA helicase II / ATP-dependent DNA helicase PcrA